MKVISSAFFVLYEEFKSENVLETYEVMKRLL